MSNLLSGEDAEIELFVEELSCHGDKIDVLQQTVEGLEATRREAARGQISGTCERG